MDQQQEKTIENVCRAFQKMKSTLTELCDERERALLKQTQEIYSSRRQQLVDLTNDEQHNTSDRMSKFFKGRSSVEIAQDLNAFESSIRKLLFTVQLQSPTHSCQNESSCLAGFTKTIQIKATDDDNNDSEVADDDKIIPTHLRVDNDLVTCQFTAPTQPGEYKLCANRGNILAPVSIRSYPPELDVPRSEFVKTNARYCSIRNGKLYVSSRYNPFVNVFDVKTGDRLKLLGGDFTKARGIAVTDDSTFIADGIRSEIAIIPHDRESVTQWFGKGRLNYPLGMIMSPDNRLFITCMEGKEIVVFKLMEKEWEEDFKLNVTYKPYDLAFDSSGNIHVAFGDKDERVAGVFVYSTSGVLVRKYGEANVRGAGGIAIDKNNYSYVAEYSEAGRLVIFDSNGNHVSSSQPLDYPMGVCIDEDGSIFVASNFTHGILVF